MLSTDAPPSGAPEPTPLGAPGPDALVEAVFSSSGVGMCVLDPGGRISRFNARWLESVGLPAEEVAGRSVWEVFPESPPELRAMYERARAGGVIDVPAHRQVVAGREIWYEGRLGPVPLPGGTGVLVTAWDITARKRIEHIIRREHEKLRRQVIGLPLALIEWDGDQRIVGYSDRAEELFGFTLDDVLGKRFDELPWVEEEDWPMARAEARELATAGKPATVSVVRNRRKDGSTIHCEWYTSAQHDASGKLVSMLSLVLDVTARVRAQEALRASEARARAVMQNVRDQLEVLEPVRGESGAITDWRYVDANPAALELLGVGPELIGRTARQVLGEAAAARRHAFLVAVLESGEPYQYEASLGDRTLLITLFRVDAQQVASASVDITERKRIEAGAESLARFPQENPDPVLRLSADAGVIYANGAAVRCLGVEPGRPAPGWLATSAGRASQAGHRVKDEIALGDAVFSAVFVPVGDEVNVYAQDITDRKRAERALSAELAERRRREAHQKLLGDIAEDFARLSTEDEITTAIGERLAAHLDVSTCSVADFEDGFAVVRSAFTRPGAVAAPAATRLRVSDYLDEELQAEAHAGRTIVIRDMQTDPRVDAGRYQELGVRAGVIVPFHRHGSWRHSFAVGTPVARDWRRDEIQLLQDVAYRLFPRIERARTEEALRRSNEQLRAVRRRLEEADRRKDEFLAVLSHELRNPLAPIRNSIQLLERSPEGEVGRRAREVLRRQTDHLVRLVSDLLDVTRITHGKIDLQLARLDAREVVRRTFADMSGDFEQREVELLLSQAGEPVWVEVDEARLGQMVTNLLNNAVKFTPRGGQVRIDVQRAGSRCEIRVRDTGIGIEPGDLGRIFEPFVQVERTRRTHGGVGIGLALVRQLAEMQGGSVRAESAGVGTGAEFVIALPLASAPHAPQRSPREGGGAGSLSILIVDDNDDAAITLADLLGMLGHFVATASSGRAGIEAIAARMPDMLLCDVGLPDVSGYEVIRAVRDLPRGRALLAVALTGYAQPRDREAAIAAGFDAHLGKPARLEELEELLSRAAREGRAGRAQLELH